MLRKVVSKWAAIAGHCRAYGTSANATRTCLYALHERLGGKMVNYADYQLPIVYNTMSIIDSHLHTRSKASCFDVSHMLQTNIYGKDRVAFIESITVADVLKLQDGQGALSLFTNYDGGIIDDLIVTVSSLLLLIYSRLLLVLCRRLTTSTCTSCRTQDAERRTWS